MKLLRFIPVFALLASQPAMAETPTAEQLLAKAKAKASSEHKTIFLHFGASWCGWCKRLDAFLDRPDIKPAFERYFVPLKLVVQENAQNKSLENAGAEAVFKKMGGPDGLPFSAFLDAKGELIVNSKGSSGNIGYPAQPAEIDYFMQMMKKTVPDMATEDTKVIETALRSFKNQPTRAPGS